MAKLVLSIHEHKSSYRYHTRRKHREPKRSQPELNSNTKQKTQIRAQVVMTVSACACVCCQEFEPIESKRDTQVIWAGKDRLLTIGFAVAFIVASFQLACFSLCFAVLSVCCMCGC